MGKVRRGRRADAHQGTYTDGGTPKSSRRSTSRATRLARLARGSSIRAAGRRRRAVRRDAGPGRQPARHPGAASSSGRPRPPGRSGLRRPRLGRGPPADGTWAPIRPRDFLPTATSSPSSSSSTRRSRRRRSGPAAGRRQPAFRPPGAGPGAERHPEPQAAAEEPARPEHLAGLGQVAAHLRRAAPHGPAAPVCGRAGGQGPARRPATHPWSGRCADRGRLDRGGRHGGRPRDRPVPQRDPAGTGGVAGRPASATHTLPSARRPGRRARFAPAAPSLEEAAAYWVEVQAARKSAAAAGALVAASSSPTCRPARGAGGRQRYDGARRAARREAATIALLEIHLRPGVSVG